MKNLKLLSVVSAVLWSVTVQQAGALDSVPMARNEVELSSVLSEHTLDWAPAYCMPQLISFQAGSRTLSIAQARVVFTSGQEQLIRIFGLQLHARMSTGWVTLERSKLDGSYQCIDRIEIIGQSLGGPSRLRVNWR